MKKVIFILITLIAINSYADEIAVSNPKLNVQGQTVNLSVDLAGTAITSDVKMMFCDSQYIDETSKIQPITDWYFSNNNKRNVSTRLEIATNNSSSGYYETISFIICEITN